MIINTPSRLHIALIDLNGSYGRVDGGVGLVLDKPDFSLRAEPSDKGVTVDFAKDITDKIIRDAAFKKVNAAAEKAIEYYKPDCGFHFTVEKAYPAHSGLGSGTQMSLAAGKLVTEIMGLHVTSYELGCVVGRGGTSGIGVHGFDKGGLIVDGGHSLKEKSTFMPSSASDAKPPVLIGRYEFPKEWSVLLAIPNHATNLNGKEEINVFQKYCPIRKNEVEQVSHLIFMNLVPFLIEKDIEEFGHALDEIQYTAFNKIEIAYLQPPKVSKLMNDMRDAGAYGVGLSSLGPTVFTVFDKNNKDIVETTKDLLGDDGSVIVTKARNHGAEITN
ncbi:MAG: beta-ribofuranosylaminobenzene 5'-phosphate synthase [Methanocorpusculum sp.]|nr:beta-ribofuranosylaminobenzene 5'-phosphate synthase [Methanocorpusculum sp.]